MSTLSLKTIAAAKTPSTDTAVKLQAPLTSSKRRDNERAAAVAGKSGAVCAPRHRRLNTLTEEEDEGEENGGDIENMSPTSLNQNLGGQSKLQQIRTDSKSPSQSQSRSQSRSQSHDQTKSPRQVLSLRKWQHMPDVTQASKDDEGETRMKRAPLRKRAEKEGQMVRSHSSLLDVSAGRLRQRKRDEDNDDDSHVEEDRGRLHDDLDDSEYADNIDVNLDNGDVDEDVTSESEWDFEVEGGAAAAMMPANDTRRRKKNQLLRDMSALTSLTSPTSSVALHTSLPGSHRNNVRACLGVTGVTADVTDAPLPNDVISFCVTEPSNLQDILRDMQTNPMTTSMVGKEDVPPSSADATMSRRDYRAVTSPSRGRDRSLEASASFLELGALRDETNLAAMLLHVRPNVSVEEENKHSVGDRSDDEEECDKENAAPSATPTESAEHVQTCPHPHKDENSKDDDEGKDVDAYPTPEQLEQYSRGLDDVSRSIRGAMALRHGVLNKGGRKSTVMVMGFGPAIHVLQTDNAQ